MGLANQMWAENSDLASAALTHPFVQAVADGTLPREIFAAYIAQDAFFLEAFIRTYALALARSPDTATLLTLADLLGGACDELRLHDHYAACWNVDRRGAEPWPATRAYTEFLLAIAATADLGTVCAAMTPCMRLYARIGNALDATAAGPYGAWVETYAGPDFEDLAKRLEQLVDDHARDRGTAGAVYRRAMQLELAFFDAAVVLAR